MAGTAITTDSAPLAPLEWESNHFGLPAAQLCNAEGSDVDLASALRLARAQRFRLLVWLAPGGRQLPQSLLDEFGGALIDRKATFARPLTGDEAEANAPRTADPAVIEYAEPTASPALVELALAAGAYSRFRVDPRIPVQKFEAMYRLWIARSVARELADAVLVAPLCEQGSASESPGGMITLAESGGVGSIGLIAVAQAARQRGIGSALMRAAHLWMRRRKAREARVVTQLANHSACRLYERFGYRLARVQHCFHFWP